MPNANEGEPQKPLTKEEIVALIAETLPQTVNAAVTTHTKRLEKALSDSFGKQFTSITETIGKLTPAEPPKGDKTDGDKKPDPQIAALTKRMEEAEGRALAAEKAAKDTETKRRAETADKALRDALTGKVKPGAEAAIAKLLAHDGVLTTDDDGNAVLRFMAEPYKGAKPELIPYTIADGVSQYLKSPEAALFIDAPNSGGSGQPRKPGTLPARGKPVEEMSNAELVAHSMREAGIS